jgi:hypothetical protein
VPTLCQRLFLVVVMLLSLARPAAAADAVAAAVPGERFVAMAPCRLLDTRVTPAANATEETVRRLDVAASRCGRFAASIATGYSIRVTAFSRSESRAIPPVTFMAAGPLARFLASGPLDLPLPAGVDLAVDLEGYYLPPGAPAEPFQQQAPASATAAAAGPSSSPTLAATSTRPPLITRGESVYNGTAGDLWLDGTRYGSTGFFASTTTSYPWFMFMSGDSSGAAGFGVYNSNFSELLRVSTNGPTRLVQGWSYLSGRTDYRETVNVPNNTVHEVRIVNPRDSLGGATTRVVFYDATTDDENGSPATTKFRAYTFGNANTQKNINFDSQIRLHWPGSTQYYFRAYSEPEAKETFWVKADTNYDSVTQTRADMYVSGKASIGTTPLSYGHQVDIQGPATVNGGVNGANELLGLYDTRNSAKGVGGGIAFGGKFNATPGTMAANLASIQGVKENVNDNDYASAMVFFTRLNGGAPTEQMRITSTGGVGIGCGQTCSMTARLDVRGDSSVTGNASVGGNGNVNGNLSVAGTITGGIVRATYQDVAEWVPSGSRLVAGTVVTIDSAKHNEVRPSFRAYDTGVAGVVSLQPGVILGEEGATKSQIATSGRVRVRVDATKHAITAGDLLVTGEKPGLAMYSEPVDLGGVKLHRPGTIIGKALEPLASGEGEILVLLSLQ